MPYLSICIPTCNQAKALDALLESIEAGWDSRLEIVICDESDGDDSSLVVEKYSKIYPIKYLNRSRGGLDKAVLDLVQIAAGDYIWWIGDDKILPGGIRTIISYLKEMDPDFLWVNSSEMSNPSHLTFNLLDSVVTHDPNDLLSFDLGLLGFITATVFRRSVAVRYLDSAASFKGSAWVCLYLILSVVTSGGKLAILKTPCFSSYPKPSGEVRWYDQFQVFGINLLHIAAQFESHFDNVKFKKSITRNLVRVLKSIIVERALGYKTGFASPSVSLKSLFINYYNYLPFWVYLPLLIVPSSLLSILYPLYKKINKGG
jgi:glycosyltransferase involved in cell wall biosynthesis